MILTVRTDNPEAEIGLYFRAGQKRQYKKWQAHRQLSETIHKEIAQLLEAEGLDWSGISAIVCYKGPGSFTGLRIGLAVANTLAYSLNVPIVSTADSGWIKGGIAKIANGDNEFTALPEYGRSPHITEQIR